ncbi:GntR family transcriptional regulator [Prevotella aurantiaca]|jgi:transcriptional regulator, gntR family|uniref:GntR family transcriptional regulator n=1 Tax=Prevotella aurantiaca TaxID=596085 RepID=A0A930HN06_9BACT|nr:GntR family transcriptional regulator [Prevotella aurantiaca]MBF1384825.1 GntR family transcriptional regulator [Prevotella aurantiaca]
MNFNSNKAIYEQMAERLCDEIIAQNYKADDRIPSVREYAIMLQVNTNTAVKAYELLAREEIIYNKRGLGYFVSSNARTRILAQRKNEFMNDMLPEVFRQMTLLNIDIKEIEKQWNLIQPV